MSRGRPAPDVELPTPPPGYDEPYRFRYPPVVLFLGSFALGLLTAGVYGLMLWTLQGASPFAAVFGAGVQPVFLPFIVAIVVTVVIHELLHGFVSVAYGYDVEYGVIFSKGVFFVAAFGQYQSREELFAILLAPLIVITVVALPGLIVEHPLVAITAYFILILNTAGSVGDIYAVWRLLRLPAGTLLYDLDTDRMYVFEPAD